MTEQDRESWRQQQAGERFWSILGKKIRAGARIPDGYDRHRH